MNRDELRVTLADYAHRTWAGWMFHLFNNSAENEDGSVTIPSGLVEQWRAQMGTSYRNLTPDEQRSGLREADAMLAFVDEFLCAQNPVRVTRLEDVLEYTDVIGTREALDTLHRMGYPQAEPEEGVE